MDVLLTTIPLGNTSWGAIANGNWTKIQHAFSSAITDVAFSAGLQSSGLSAITFSNSNGVSFALNGSTLSASTSAPHFSSYQNVPFLAWTEKSYLSIPVLSGSTSYCQGLIVSFPLSASFIRIPVSMALNASTLSSTGSSLSASAQLFTTWNVVFYSAGTGASSASLLSAASARAEYTMLNSISAAANGTQCSYSQSYIYRVEGNIRTTSTQYSLSSSIYRFHISWLTNFSGFRWLDIDFNQSLAEGSYWMVIGFTTSSSTNSTRLSNATKFTISPDRMYGIYIDTPDNTTAFQFAPLGSTNASVASNLGIGSFSTAGGGTQSVIAMSNISYNASIPMPFVQILRSS